MSTTDPLTYRFTVDCSAEHAFETWTAKIDSWWPKDHAIGGSPDMTIAFEAGPGGRLVERTADGAEHEWGRITSWEPPHRLAYTWLVGGPESDGTDVEVTFTDEAPGRCVVEVVHGGWERLAAAGPERRAMNRVGWTALLDNYREFLA